MSSKIFIIAGPAAGHLNPILSTVSELKKISSKIVIYSTKPFCTLIERHNVEYRELINVVDDPFKVENQSQLALPEILLTMTRQQLGVCDQTLVQLVTDILTDKPDLVIFDTLCLYAKWAVRFIGENNANLPVLSNVLKMDVKEPMHVPKFCVYGTTFLTLEGVFPSSAEMAILNNCSWYTQLKAMLNIPSLLYQAYRLSSKYSMKYVMPIKELMSSDAGLVVGLTYPELQPKSEKFDQKKTKFVGSCINTNIRLNGLSGNNNPLEQFLVTVSTKRLIYMSLGTVFNEKISVYVRMIEAFNSEEIQSLDKDFIISTGPLAFSELEKLIEKGELKVASNVRLVSSAPQLRILQNCSLFVTHCGFNSISESIHFGVPMLCIPISADQPLVAYRVSNELELGIKLDSDKFTVNDAIASIQKILNDKSYNERLEKFSEISKKYNGPVNFATEIKSYLNV